MSDYGPDSVLEELRAENDRLKRRLSTIALKLNGIANAMASVAVVPNAAQLDYWRKAVEEAYDLARADTPAPQTSVP